MLITNFLDDETFNNIKNIITSNDMPWYTQPGAAKEGDGQVLFTHVLINEKQQINSGLFETIGRPIIDKVKSIEPDFFRTLRMKINCLPNQAKVIKSSYHTDLLSNTNNACVFDGNKEHRSVSQTNSAYRWNINFNYET